MRDLRMSFGTHPKYFDCPDKQKAFEEGVDAMAASILDLVATVTHKRLTQFAEVMAESIEKKRKEKTMINTENYLFEAAKLRDKIEAAYPVGTRLKCKRTGDIHTVQTGQVSNSVAYLSGHAVGVHTNFGQLLLEDVAEWKN